MKLKIAAFATVLTLAAGTIFAQQQQQSAQSSPAAQPNQPRPKSQKEADALRKVQEAAQQNNPDAEVQAINYVLENFADTEYKNMLLNMAMDAEQRKGDYGQTVAYGQRAIQADPNDVTARVTLAQTIAAHTRENDLDKDKSTKQATDYANQALNLLNTASTPPPGIPAEQWPDYKKDLTAEAHDALGMVADVNKQYPDAISQYKTSLNVASKPSPVTLARLAKAYNGAKQYDDAINAANQVLAMNDAPPVVKQFAEQQKDVATKLKSGPAK